MARSKKEDAAWESYRDELRAMFLDQRLTVEQIQQRMSQQYKFSKSKGQYFRQFKKWNFKKHLTDDDWRFIGHRREKRKREGKDPGSVTVNGAVVSEDTIRKQLPRHILPSAQYLATVGEEPGPATPDGIVVGTPKSDMQAENFHTAEMPIERSLGLAETQAIIHDTQLTDFLAIVDGIYGQPFLKIPELFRLYFGDTAFIAWYHSEPTAVIGELVEILTTFLNGDMYLICGSLFVREMVKGASLSFAESLFNPTWQKPSNLAMVRENIYKDLVKKAEDFIKKADVLLQREWLGDVLDCTCFYSVLVVYSFCLWIVLHPVLTPPDNRDSHR